MPQRGVFLQGFVFTPSNSSRGNWKAVSQEKTQDHRSCTSATVGTVANYPFGNNQRGLLNAFTERHPNRAANAKRFLALKRWLWRGRERQARGAEPVVAWGMIAESLLWPFCTVLTSPEPKAHILHPHLLLCFLSSLPDTGLG